MVAAGGSMRLGRPEPIRALTGLRIVGAVWVVLHHLQPSLYSAWTGFRVLEPVLMLGTKGVPLFFLLSGYIIWHNYGSRSLVSSPRAVARFLWRRFARLWPVNVLALVLSVPLIWNAVVVHANWGEPVPDWFSLHGFAASAFMVEVLGSPTVHYPWNQPAWSLSPELAAYALFPLAVAAALALKVRAGWPCLVGGLGLALLAYLPTPEFPYRWLGELLLVFVAGVLLRIAGRPRRALGLVMTAQVAAPAAVVLACYLGLPWLIAPLLALWVWSLAAPSGPGVAFMASKPMQVAGLASYSLYMLHWVVFGYGYLAIARVPTERPVMVLFVAMALLSASVLSWLCWRFFETPSRRLLNAVFDRVWPGVADPTVTEERLEEGARSERAAHVDDSEYSDADRSPVESAQAPPATNRRSVPRQHD